MLYCLGLIRSLTYNFYTHVFLKAISTFYANVYKTLNNQMISQALAFTISLFVESKEQRTITC